MHATALAPLTKAAPARPSAARKAPAAPTAQLVWTLRSCSGDPKRTPPAKDCVVLDLTGEDSAWLWPGVRVGAGGGRV